MPHTPIELSAEMRQRMGARTPGVFLPAPMLSRSEGQDYPAVPPQLAQLARATCSIGKAHCQPAGLRSSSISSSGDSQTISTTFATSTTTYAKRQTHQNYTTAGSSSTFPSMDEAGTRLSNVGDDSWLGGRASHIGRSASSLAGTENHEIICALCEDRGILPEVGIALINLSTNEAEISQISDSKFYVRSLHKLQIHDPVKVLVPSGSSSPSPSPSLCRLIAEELPGATIVALDRKFWSAKVGLECVRRLAHHGNLESLQVALAGNLYATSSFSAVTQYIETHLDVHVMANMLRIHYRPSEDTMMIDLAAIESLEILENSRNPKSKLSLLGLLDQTRTKMGRRVLIRNILQPPTEAAVIEKRQDAVAELSANRDMLYAVRKALNSFTDVEKLLSRLVIEQRGNDICAVEKAINTVLELKSFLIAVPALSKALLLARCSLLASVRAICLCDAVRVVLDLISECVNQDTHFAKTPIEKRNQRTYAVKSGVLGLLDVDRSTFKQLTDELHTHVDEIKTRLGLKTALLKFQDVRQYYLSISDADFEGKPPPHELINGTYNRGRFECQTLGMVKLNYRLANTAADIMVMSDGLIQQLLSNTKEHAMELFAVCESIAMLDMLAGFAHLANNNGYSRPKLADAIAYKSARHPLLEQRAPDSIVPNDVYATSIFHFHIITGCNMSGKSTYLRMIALLQVMGQLGSFIPAMDASLPIMHNLFARISTDDCMEASLSTFSLEMRDIAFILRNINDKSLVIIDELGRGTSTHDGLSIALATCQALLRSKAQVVFATHFLQLSQAFIDDPAVLSLHLQTELSDPNSSNSQLRMLYKVTGGPETQSLYGIRFARAFDLPIGLVECAERKAKELIRRQEAKRAGSQFYMLARRRRLLAALHQTLKDLVQSDLTDQALWSYMARLQEDLVMRLAEGDEEAECHEDGEVID